MITCGRVWYSAVGIWCSMAAALGQNATNTVVLPPCTAVFTLEIFDSATGVTHAVVPGESEQNGSTVTKVGAISILPCISSAGSFSAQVRNAQLSAGLLRPSVSARISLTALPLPGNPAPPASAVLPCIAAFSVKIYDTSIGVMHAYAVGQSAPDTVSPSGLVRRPR